MSLLLKIYRPISLLEVPGIHTSLLWDLVVLFSVLAGVYFLLIFWLRNRISAKKMQIRSLKKELAPMISNFLFFQQESDQEGTEEYIGMKIDIRELLKDPLNRVVMTEVLMDLRMDVSGEARDRVFALYQDLGLDKDAFLKLKSWRWERISQGILELTEMEVGKAYPYIRKFINDRRGVIRKQAQLASVTLKEEGISYFLDTARYRISEWQQLKLLEVLRNREGYEPPRFNAWLTSENRDVVLFALRLIRHYRQNDAEAATITLLQHRNETVKAAALECIREFRFESARPALIRMFKRSGEELKILVLDTLEHVSGPQDLEFLQTISSKDPSFIVRSKAKSVMNAIQPDSALPTRDIIAPGREIGVSGHLSFDDPSAEKHEQYETAAMPQQEPQSDHKSEAEPGLPAEALPVQNTETEMEEAQEDGYRQLLLEIQGEPPTEAQASQPETCTFALSSLEAKADIEISDEELAIFDLCLWQELDAILNEQEESEEIGILPLDFLPVVAAEALPAEYPVQKWLLEVEVDADIIEVHPESPVETPEGITEPEASPKKRGSDTQPEGPKDQVFELNFLPFIVSSSDSDENKGKPQNKPEKRDKATSLFTPLFEWDGNVESRTSEYTTSVRTDKTIAESPATEDLAKTSEFFFDWTGERVADLEEMDNSGPSPKEMAQKADPQENQDEERFSIFEEFFRHYDTESKLIMMEQIPEVGEEKELDFLMELAEDINPQIREKAKELSEVLRIRLGIEHKDQPDE